MTLHTIKDVRSVLVEIYRNSGPLDRLLTFARPSICPFHTLVGHVPQGSDVLDVGCGTGIFLNLLTHENRIARGIAFDANGAAIEVAQAAQSALSTAADVVFQHRRVEEGMPAGRFDVVSMIDVIHHISPDHQRDAVTTAAERVAEGGLFLFKDIGPRPLFRAWANRLYDLVLARQWIHYVWPDEIVSWLEPAGFQLEIRQTINMVWYGHELLVFRRSGAPI